MGYFIEMNFDGIDYLTDEARASNFGSIGEVRYYANGINVETKEHVTIEWLITHDDYANLEDESDACNWDVPNDIKYW